MTSFIIEHQCPQCGAPAELEETDRLIHCGFCRVGSYLHVSDVFRYVLPHRAPEGQELIYFPYWRFKGMFFSCFRGGMDKRYSDFSQQAIVSHDFPMNLGFRTQTQKLRFAGTHNPGIFLKPEVSRDDLMDGLNARFGANLPKPLLHQAHIGEMLSLLFAPFYLKGEELFDAILNEPLRTGSAESLPALLDRRQAPAWPMTFIATLCPQCGWDLKGISDALALTCDNCLTTWWARRGKLEELKTAYVPSANASAVYMPFWRIKAQISGMTLDSYADLIRIANLPKVVQPGFDEQPFYFWAPAFKVRPQRFLSYGAHVTASQPQQAHVAGHPKGKRLYGVNLPIEEAVESLKLILTFFVRPRNRLEEVLQSMQISAQRFRLVYLPFNEGPHELVHSGMNLAINRNLLSHARGM
jgi:hypothetical protein